jgi:hypothetical protein
MADGITQGRESVFATALQARKTQKTYARMYAPQNHPQPTLSLKERAKEEAEG